MRERRVRSKEIESTCGGFNRTAPYVRPLICTIIIQHPDRIVNRRTTQRVEKARGKLSDLATGTRLVQIRREQAEADQGEQGFRHSPGPIFCGESAHQQGLPKDRLPPMLEGMMRRRGCPQATSWHQTGGTLSQAALEPGSY